MNRTGQKDMKPGNRQHRRGGITESEMTPGQRQRERESNRQWRHAHPDLVKAAQAKYWTKKAAEMRESEQ